MSGADDRRETGCGGAHAGELGGAGDDQGAGSTRRSAGAPGGTIARLLPDQAATGGELAPTRGPGRPKGARNLRTEQTAIRLIETYGDPLEADVAIGTMPPGELVTLLRSIASDRGIKMGMSLGDVLKLQAECRRAALPYMHAKRATTDARGDPVTPVIAFGTFTAGQRAAHGRSIEEVVQNQQLIEHDPAKSDGEKSDDAPSD